MAVMSQVQSMAAQSHPTTESSAASRDPPESLPHCERIVNGGCGGLLGAQLDCAATCPLDRISPMAAGTLPVCQPFSPRSTLFIAPATYSTSSGLSAAMHARPSRVMYT